MGNQKILITVKTYPSLDPKYIETVCTAGIKEDGSWVRIYPVPFRRLDYNRRYSKYQWVTMNLVKNNSDPRPESFKPVNYNHIKIGEKIGTERAWKYRRDVVLKKVYTNITHLIKEAKNKRICTSLAVFKPKLVLKFVIQKDRRDWEPHKLKLLEAKAKQTNLFNDSENPFKVFKKIPYKISYEFIDEEETKVTLMIADWEMGQLYWKCLLKNGNDEKKACQDVKKKYYDDFVKTKDLHLFLGTTRLFHFHYPNPFIIVGTFHPPQVYQPELF